ncbi:uncharacterized protein LOC119081826 [Bradysia coprophila]|uniref:uncharacterized protein LOC119081826 n=1 Tax=Bradysia coprophila TaxID=38358 RepID=UPI00187DAE3A|nr:uncharacterized protein LOC119081826 [Bradysia coprophila]
MFQLLLMWFIAIGVVSCVTNNCPIFSAFENNATLFNELQGTFLKVLAIGTSPVAPCQKQTFTIGTNNLISQGYFQSPDWCLRLNNCISNTDYQECDLTPLSPVKPGTLPSPERNQIKLAGKVGEGESACFIYAYCRISEEGMYVLCRQPLKSPVTRFIAFFELLTNLLTPPLPHVTLVNQTNCTFPNSCPP